MIEKTGVHKRVCDCLVSYVCEIGNVTTNSSWNADGCIPMEVIKGNTLDITEYLDFVFWDLVTFRSNTGYRCSEIER